MNSGPNKLFVVSLTTNPTLTPTFPLLRFHQFEVSQKNDEFKQFAFLTATKAKQIRSGIKRMETDSPLGRGCPLSLQLFFLGPAVATPHFEWTIHPPAVN